MASFRALVLPAFDSCLFERELLSHSIANYICDALCAAGGKVYSAGSFCGLRQDVLTGCFPDPEDISAFFFPAEEEMALIFFAPAPTVTQADILGLLRAAREDGIVSLKAAKITLAVAGKTEAMANLDLSDLLSIPALDAHSIPVVQDAESAYTAQEVLRRRINMGHLKNGVMLVDPPTAFISPRARLTPGCTILPGCMINGECQVGEGSVIGPNAVLTDAIIGDNTSVNASQVIQSRVGSSTTVGPFAYIRPGCDIGDHVRIGDFVELKNSNIGRGTKISHLTYIGDSDFGERINVGCGVITSNYDGKSKHRTVVDDGSFIGCNVNLLPPIKIGADAYIAAGSTVDSDIEPGSLAIARTRQVVKPGWVARRKESGKL